MLVLIVTLDDGELQVLHFNDTTWSFSSPYESTTLFSRPELRRNYIYIQMLSAFFNGYVRYIMITFIIIITFFYNHCLVSLLFYLSDLLLILFLFYSTSKFLVNFKLFKYYNFSLLTFHHFLFFPITFLSFPLNCKLKPYYYYYYLFFLNLLLLVLSRIKTCTYTNI